MFALLRGVSRYHCCLFAYGQTGSGKTFTLQGDDMVLGIAQLSFKYLYQLVKHQSDQFNFKISVTMV